MAEATGLRNNALNYPVYGCPFAIVFPITEGDGTLVTAAAGLDSLVSLNGNTAGACTNEATEIATSSGIYYLLLTAAELTADVVAGITQTSTTDAKTTAWMLYPRKLVSLASGTSQGGAAGYITLAAGTVEFNNQFSGCLCVATIDSNVEARILQVCTASNQQCTVTPGWNVAPDADDTYVIYLPEGMRYPTADVRYIATDALDAAAVKADAVTKIQAGLATPTNITAGTITTVTNLTNAPTAGDLTATMKTSVTTAAAATALSESYAADGSTASPIQLLYMIWSMLAEKAVSGVTLTTRKVNGGTTAMTFTLDDGVAPTSITRAT